jgi:hypothetical protein
MNTTMTDSFTYDHFFVNAFDPVRSRIIKHERGGLVLRWVTTGESPLLYVFSFCPSEEKEGKMEAGEEEVIGRGAVGAYYFALGMKAETGKCVLDRLNISSCISRGTRFRLHFFILLAFSFFTMNHIPSML